MVETVTAPLTAEQFAEIGDDFQGELIRGELVPMMLNRGGHEVIALRIASALHGFVSARGVGLAFGGQMGFVLARNPDTVRAPDASFVSTARLPANWATFYIEGAPDLAVEVRSPSDRGPQLLAKVAEYLNAGSRLVWVVDPRRRTVMVYDAEQAITLTSDDALDGADVLLGFRLPVAELFAGLPDDA